MIIEQLEPRRLFSAGQIDTTFGQNGRILTDFGEASATIQHIAVTPDGRILAAGYAKLNDGTSALAMARYQSDGTLDPSFGDHGQLVEPMMGNTVNGVAISHRGQIYVGWSHTQLLRFQSNGALDTTFGQGGVLEPTIGVSCLAATNDGGVIVGADAASFDLPGTTVGAIERFKFNGHHDLHFGQRAVYRFRGKTDEDVLGVLSEFSGGVDRLKVRPDNTILAVEFEHTVAVQLADEELGIPEFTNEYYGGHYFSLLGEGASDSATQLDEGGITDWIAYGSAINSDDSVTTLDNQETIRHFLANGEEDLSYFHHHASTADDPLLINASWIVPQTKGRMIVGAQYGMLISRFNRDGTTDASFGDNGTLNLGSSILNALDATEALDGSLWLAGGHKGDFALTRLWNDEAPTASARYAERTSSAATTQKIFVTYRDDIGVYAPSIDRNDLRVYLPDGTSRPVSLFSKKTVGSNIEATYAFAAPGGAWDAADNGEYIVRVKGKQVTDIDGNAMEGRAIGSFVVNIK